MVSRVAVAAYVPVIQRGYLNFFRGANASAELYVWGDELIGRFDYLRKEIRALQPDEACRALEALLPNRSVGLLSEAVLQELAATRAQLVLPDDDISRQLASQSLSECEVHFEKVFLRWDRDNSLASIEVEPDEVVSREEMDRRLMKEALQEADSSSDWWRQVGALLVKDGQVLLRAHNTHQPTEYGPYLSGDPRNAFKKGLHLEVSTAVHAEALIIGSAAKQGIVTAGCDLVVSTFPCPPCAKLIASSGVSRLYYSDGYGVLDGLTVLRDAGVKMIRVDMK
jgi:dCMP deaminase